MSAVTTQAKPETPTIVIQPSRGWISLQLRNVWQYRELLYFLVWRDIKVRYKQMTLDVAEALIEHLHSEVAPEIVHEFRAGDIRHCFADVGRLQALGYQPQVRFEDGMAELVAWVRAQTAVDGFERARQELTSRGLTA